MDMSSKEVIGRGRRSDNLEIEDSDAPKNPHEHHTGQFTHSVQFWLSCLGSAVGYGNIWRFPYVLFTNGGGAFFVPYFICILIIVFPLYYLETAYGQLFKKALHRYFDSINSKFLGLSYAVGIISFFTSIFLTTLLAWCINFLINSFQNPLPWLPDNHDSNVFWKQGYFRHELLQVSEGIGDYNHIVTWIAISFVISGIMNYLTIFRSLESVGYAVYVIIPLPYILLTILFFRGITLEGFYEGWIYLFKPDWTKLWTFKIWKDAGAQVIFSCTLGVNTMILFASNRDRNEKILPAAIGIPIMNFMTSIFASSALFAFLGYASVKTGVAISDMPIEGTELAFVVYPALITTLPFAQFWAILFFVMLICLGLSSQFPYYEVCSSFIHGILTRHERFRGVSKQLVCILYCSVILIIDILLLASDAGFYWFNLLDHYTAGLNLLIILFAQTIVLGWFLDLDTLEKEVIKNGEQIPWIYKLSIKYISPAFLLFLIFLGIIDEFRMPLDMPVWALTFGAFVSISPLFMIGYYLVFNKTEKDEDQNSSLLSY